MCLSNFLIVFILYGISTNIIVDCVDWTLDCSTKCHCKWINGKKSAICNALSLTQIPSNLSVEIQVLMMNENDIATLNREEFNSLGLINLQKIFLKKSNIKYLHKETFKNLKILIELDLSENLIEQLDKQIFSGNDRLRILYLYSNPIKALLPEQFPLLSHLRTIDLHDCLISSIDSTSFSNVDSLEYLNLESNKLQHLPHNVFTHMKNLKTLLLDENPWNCDCKLKNFRNWYVKNNLNRISLLCKAPSSLIEQSWEDIGENDFGCAPTLEIFKGDVEASDVESNITFKCYTIGDPRPTISWHFNGKVIEENENNVVIETTTTNGDGEVITTNTAADLALKASPSSPYSSHIPTTFITTIKNNGNSLNVDPTLRGAVVMSQQPASAGSSSIAAGELNSVVSSEYHHKIWSNLSIYNITNFNAGLYTCVSYNNLGSASANVSLNFPERVEHVFIKNSETFWYFGLIIGVFVTIIGFLLISITFFICRRVVRSGKIKNNIKGSISFNDQEKKLLDLSITTTTERTDKDGGETLNTPSTTTSIRNKSDSSIIALEPVQITMENFHHSGNLQHHLHYHRRISDEIPLNISIFPPPPPEFCCSMSTTAQSSLANLSSNGQLYQTSYVVGNGNHANVIHNNNNPKLLQQQYDSGGGGGGVLTSAATTTTNSTSIPPNIPLPPSTTIGPSITMSLTNDSSVNEASMYPDLLNIIPNRMKISSTANNLSSITSPTISSTSSSCTAVQQIVPINIESYVTLPKNKHHLKQPTTSSSSPLPSSNCGIVGGGGGCMKQKQQQQQSSPQQKDVANVQQQQQHQQPVSILKQTQKNYDKNMMISDECFVVANRNGNDANVISKCCSCALKNDNMGLRTTVSGNINSIQQPSLDEHLHEDNENLSENYKDSESAEDDDVMEENRRRLPCQNLYQHHQQQHHQRFSSSTTSPLKNIQLPLQLDTSSSSTLLMPNDFVPL